MALLIDPTTEPVLNKPDLAPQHHLRQPGLPVYLIGLGVSAVVIYATHLLAASGTNVMGWYANAIIPVGALFVGIVAGLGYALASYYMNVKLSRAFVLGMLVTAFVDYWGGEYLAYTRILEEHHLSTDALPFFSYVARVCESMTFSHNGGTPSGQIGWGGYFFKALEVAGFCGGMMIPSATLFRMPYCRPCQNYLKKNRTTFVNSVDTRRDLFALPRKERKPALERIAGTLQASANEIASGVSGIDLAATQAYLDQLQPDQHKTSAARLTVVLRKCPRCDGHHVDITLTHVTLDKKQAAQSLYKIDKPVAAVSAAA